MNLSRHCVVLAGAAAWIAASAWASGPAQPSRSFAFEYDVILNAPPGARQIEAWVPVPHASVGQEILDLRVEASTPYRIMSEPTYGNHMVHLTASGPFNGPIETTLRFQVRRKEYEGTKPAAPPDERFLQPNRLVPISGVIGRLADKVTAGKTDTLDKARAIYEYVTETVSYDKSGSGWGHGDALFACDAKKGNCTDFHALFIAMARSAGIPARFNIGFPLPPDKDEGTIPGYHCWAEFYVKGRGWVPVDSSEANKHPALRDYYFGRLDPNRVLFTTGRDLILQPPQKGDPINYFVYPYVEVDGRPLADKNRVKVRFSFKNV